MQQQQQQGGPHRRLQGARGVRGSLRSLLKHSGEVRAAPVTVPIPNAWYSLKKTPVDSSISEGNTCQGCPQNGSQTPKQDAPEHAGYRPRDLCNLGRLVELASMSPPWLHQRSYHLCCIVSLSLNCCSMHVCWAFCTEVPTAETGALTWIVSLPRNGRVAHPALLSTPSAGALDHALPDDAVMVFSGRARLYGLASCSIL